MQKQESTINFFDGEFYTLHCCDRCMHCVWTQKRGDMCVRLEIPVKKYVRNDCTVWNKPKVDEFRMSRKRPKLKY